MAAKQRTELSYPERVAALLIEQLKAGTAPWQKPWQPGELRAPYNPTTDKEYRGFNQVWLMMQSQGDARWMTYKQAEAIGAQVRKGEKGTAIHYVTYRGEQGVTDEKGAPVIDEATGKQKKEVVEYERPRSFMAIVFNASQIDGLAPAPPRANSNEWERHERAEAILRTSGVPIRHIEGNKAYYMPSLDEITLPLREQFDAPDKYYAVALHELGHATGHPRRLNRDMVHPFGSEGYAKEELRAEIASLMLGERLDIGHDPGQHAAYVNSWIKALNDDPREIMRAASDAAKIATYVESFQLCEQERFNTQTTQLTSILSTDIEPVIHGPRRLHYETFQGASIEDALRSRGLNTIADVVGIDPTRFVEHAQTTLAPVFGLTPEDPHEGNQHHERMGMVHEFCIHARELVRDAAADQSQQPEHEQKQEPAMQEQSERQYLTVPYKEKDAAKKAGAKWDKGAKQWYAGEGADLAGLAQWMPKQDALPPIPMATEATPQEQFADALRAHGLIITGEPVMNGVLQRVPVEGDKGPEKSGAYTGHLDGIVPAGYIQNFKSGEKTTWKATGIVDSLNDADRERLASETATKLADREQRRGAAHKATAAACEALIAICGEADPSHPYLQSKGLQDASTILQVPKTAEALPEHSNVVIAATLSEATTQREKRPDALVVVAGQLVIPVTDWEGKVQTIQTIDGTGRKHFAPGGKLEGGMHACRMARHTQSTDAGTKQPIIIAEGFATAQTISETTGATTYTAFTAANMMAVALAVREHHPDSPIIIAGDNDHQRAREVNPLTQQLKPNAGKVAAEAAADAVKGITMLPAFGESSKGTDWNDHRKEYGPAALIEAVNESALLADRRQLADARMNGHDAERIELNIINSAGQALNSKAPNADIKRSAYSGLRIAAGRVTDDQDTSDEPTQGRGGRR